MKINAVRVIVVLLLIGASAFATNAQANKPKPDFTGTWLLDQKKSNDSGLTRRPDLPIKILHRDPEFRVTVRTEKAGQIIEREFVYFTDGRGESNPLTSFVTTNPSAINADELKKQIARSKTKWSGNKIVTRTQQRVQAGGHFADFEQVDEWKLSEDGKVLIQTNRITFQQSSGVFVPGMATDKKRVYNRV